MSQPLEGPLVLAVQQHLAFPLARDVVVFCARWLIYFFIPFVFLARRTPLLKHAVYEACWTAMLAFAASTAIAAFIGRVRPYLSVTGVEALVPPNIQAGSFPSSHTAIAIGVATALAFANVPTGVVAFVMAFLILFGRVAAGMHFPTDVLGGFFVGMFAFLIVRLAHYGLARLA
jgi:membrane-associated phospholipid phosphatase